MSSAGALEATSVGAYTLIRKIGEGGMGEVWEAEHAMIGRRAAIKFLLPELTASAGTVERFFNEARAVAAVADPGIIQIYDFGRTDARAYLVMELLEGEELSARLKRLHRLPAIEVVRLARQIATSLAAVHDKGIIHRDLKPDNVFVVGDPAVTGGERTKLLDFGIAKLTQHDSRFKTQTGAMVGTPAYMSPEQCRATPIDHRSDLYSLGVMMFVMVCGRPPFEGEGSGDVLIAQVRDAPPRPSSIHAGTPRELEAVIMRCLEKQPDARYASAKELEAALARVEQLLASRAAFGPTAELGVTYDGAPVPARRSRAWLGALAGLVVAAAIVAIVLATRTAARDEPAAPAATAPTASAPPASAPMTSAPTTNAPAAVPAPRPAALPSDAAVAPAPPHPPPRRTPKPKPPRPPDAPPTPPTIDRGD